MKTFNDYVTIYPNRNGFIKMKELLCAKRKCSIGEAASYIQLHKTENGGYRDRLVQIILDYNNMFLYDDKTYFESTEIVF
jgi:hypothetical protein